MSNVDILGGKELDDLLQTLPAKLEKNIMRSALAAGARVIGKEAKVNAPVGRPSNVSAKLYGGYPGALRDSVRVTTGMTKKGAVYSSVKAGGRTKKGASVFYAHIVEYGARRHMIAPKKAAALAIGGQNITGAVEHPGVKPHAFMLPAFDLKAKQAVQAVQDKVRARLQKEGVDVPAPIEVEL